jgi:hypothetical protein
LMFPDLVDKFSKWAMEGQYMEEMAQAPWFDDTDEEENEENNSSRLRWWWLANNWAEQGKSSVFRRHRISNDAGLS